MAERIAHRYAYVSDGSNTTVKTGPGSLYSIQVSPGHGSTLTIVDSADLGAAPDLNSDSLTGIIGRVGEWSTSSNGIKPSPDTLSFVGLGFNVGLTLAATSNARLIVEYE